MSMRVSKTIIYQGREKLHRRLAIAQKKGIEWKFADDCEKFPIESFKCAIYAPSP